VVVPHTHWDREWYAPFETMRFHLVKFFDELIDLIEREPSLPAFLLDGQAVMVEDYLEVRRDQRDRVVRLVAAGRLRPGPNYVQPDEFHVSGEALVRNLLIGCQVAGEFGWVVREGYLPDTFGHVAQLPQILRGFGIETFYAMRGFGEDPDRLGCQFWWQAPDGSRVLTEWLTESYSNAAVLTADPERMLLHHGALVRYDSLPELLDRMGPRAATGVLLLLNGGDHLRVQHDVAGMVKSLDAGVAADIRLGSLEDFHELVAAGSRPETVVSGELRYGRQHAVFDGIGSTRTPLKALNERTEAYLTGVAERVDALATLVDGRSSLDSLRHAWRELVKNYAHDSICGCSVDEVIDEMMMRFTTIGQVTQAVTEDALARIASRAAPVCASGEIPVVVVNPSGFVRSGPVSVDVLPDVDAPVGQRRFGWVQGGGVELADYYLVDQTGRTVDFTRTPAARLRVVDVLDRRKELLLDEIRFTAVDVPAMGTSVFRLVPRRESSLGGPVPAQLGGGVYVTSSMLDNGIIRVEVESGGTLALTDHRSRTRFEGLLGLVDDADAGDEYGFAPLSGDQPIAPDPDCWSVESAEASGTLVVRHRLALPVGLSDDRQTRSSRTAEVTVTATLRLFPGDDIVGVDVEVDNQARDHRLRLCFPTGLPTRFTVAESAFGVVRRDGRVPDSQGWQDLPSGVFALRRFVAIEHDAVGLQILAEGLHEYSSTPNGTIFLTVLRAVGWLARIDHPLRPHKIGPELPTPGAQCLGPHRFRLAFRPYSAQQGVGHLYRAAEEFSVALQASAPWGQSPHGLDAPLVSPGLQITPDDVVVSALKTPEDRHGLLLRVFNSADRAVAAHVSPTFRLDSAERCDLEERTRTPLAVQPDGSVSLPLRPAEIASVVLHPVPSEGEVENP
jgi:mannosylglycerate hydrolase